MTSKHLYNAVGLVLLLSWLAADLPYGIAIDEVTMPATLIGAAALLIFVVWSCVLVVWRRLPPVPGLCCGLVALALILFAFLPGGEGVVARAVSADGVEMVILQDYRGEPYQVSFYARGRDGAWGKFYYEHEDTRWFGWLSRIQIAEDGLTATVYRTFWPVARYDIALDAFTLLRWQSTSTTKDRMPPGWSPEVAAVVTR